MSDSPVAEDDSITMPGATGPAGAWTSRSAWTVWRTLTTKAAGAGMDGGTTTIIREAESSPVPQLTTTPTTRSTTSSMSIRFVSPDTLSSPPAPTRTSEPEPIEKAPTAAQPQEVETTSAADVEHYTTIGGTVYVYDLPSSTSTSAQARSSILLSSPVVGSTRVVGSSILSSSQLVSSALTSSLVQSTLSTSVVPTTEGSSPPETLDIPTETPLAPQSAPSRSSAYDPSTSNAAVGANQNGQGNGSSVSKGTAAGAIIGGLFAFFAVLALILFGLRWWKRRQRRERQEHLRSSWFYGGDVSMPDVDGDEEDEKPSRVAGHLQPRQGFQTSSLTDRVSQRLSTMASSLANMGPWALNRSSSRFPPLLPGSSGTSTAYDPMRDGSGSASRTGRRGSGARNSQHAGQGGWATRFFASASIGSHQPTEDLYEAEYEGHPPPPVARWAPLVPVPHAVRHVPASVSAPHALLSAPPEQEPISILRSTMIPQAQMISRLTTSTAGRVAPERATGPPPKQPPVARHPFAAPAPPEVAMPQDAVQWGHSYASPSSSQRSRSPSASTSSSRSTSSLLSTSRSISNRDTLPGASSASGLSGHGIAFGSMLFPLPCGSSSSSAPSSSAGIEMLAASPVTHAGSLQIHRSDSGPVLHTASQRQLVIANAYPSPVLPPLPAAAPLVFEYDSGAAGAAGSRGVSVAETTSVYSTMSRGTSFHPAEGTLQVISEGGAGERASTVNRPSGVWTISGNAHVTDVGGRTHMASRKSVKSVRWDDGSALVGDGVPRAL